MTYTAADVWICIGFAAAGGFLVGWTARGIRAWREATSHAEADARSIRAIRGA